MFEQEPEKYVQAWLPMPSMMQEPLKGDLAAWMEWASLEPTASGEYANSEDKANFEKWRKQVSTD